MILNYILYRKLDKVIVLSNLDAKVYKKYLNNVDVIPNAKSYIRKKNLIQRTKGLFQLEV